MGRKANEINPLDCKTAADWLRYCASTSDWSQGDEPNVMISYSVEDSYYKDQLRMHLAPALAKIRDNKLSRSFEIWDFARRGSGVHIGQHFPTEVAERMWRCRAAVIVLSPNYINSDYCFNIELPFLLWRGRQNLIDLFLFRLNSTSLDSAPIELPKVPPVSGQILLSQMVDDRNPSLHDGTYGRDHEALFKQLHEERPAKAEERLARFSKGIADSVDLRQTRRENRSVDQPQPVGLPLATPAPRVVADVSNELSKAKDPTKGVKGKPKDDPDDGNKVAFSKPIERDVQNSPKSSSSDSADAIGRSGEKAAPQQPWSIKLGKLHIAAALIAVAAIVTAGGGLYHWQSTTIEQLETSRTLYRDAVDRLKQQTVVATRGLEQLEASRLTYQQALDQALQEANASAAKVAQLDASRTLYREALDRAVQEADWKQGELAKENDELKTTISRQNLEIARLGNEVADASNLMPAAMDEKRVLQGQLKAADAANTALTNKIKDLEAQHVRASEEIKQLDSANGQLQSQITAVEKVRQDEINQAVAQATATEAIWGAAARSNSGRVYTIEHQLNEDAAKENVLALCKGTAKEKSVSGCRILKTYSNSCFVLTRPYNERPNSIRFVSDVWDDRQTGHEKMLASCQAKFRTKCRVSVSSCSPDLLHSTLNE